jgi:dTMP kinase
MLGMLPAEKVRRGVLITFEGPDGSGKSTQIRVLADKLKEEGCNVLLTREPGGTEIGEQIRAVLHDTKNTAMQPRAEVLLYCAARAQLVGQIVRPHLGGGGLVLSDRYFDSTLAYQGYGHGMDIGALRHIVDFATGGLEPDLTLLLDVVIFVLSFRVTRRLLILKFLVKSFQLLRIVNLMSKY